ncbi:MAG: DUF4381 family protein [Sphingobacteriales bacterium]|nr:DUF4381 family protein [Sphingobacteriales bacterium]MBI3720713.1 DUF4381 family protein [Sphingobacteriales bacterium]
MGFKNILTGICLLIGLTIFAQPKPSAIADKVEILIGEQIKLKLSANIVTDDFNANGFAIPDSIKHFEILEKGPVDSSITSGVKSMSQTITLTSFDSGIWVIPKIGLLTKLPTGYSDSILVKVGFDPTKIDELNDIKTIEEVKVNTSWIYWTLGAVTLLAVIGFIIFLYKTKFGKKEKVEEEIIVSKVPAFEEAMESLQKLRQRSITHKEEAKQLHAELTSVLKRYLIRAHSINTLKSTTSEMLIQLKDNLISQSQLSSVADALRLNDAVKFASYFPPQNETNTSISQIEETIQLLNKNKQA